jgi:hypothetical protein
VNAVGNALTLTTAPPLMFAGQLLVPSIATTV